MGFGTGGPQPPPPPSIPRLGRLGQWRRRAAVAPLRTPADGGWAAPGLPLAVVPSVTPAADDGPSSLLDVGGGSEAAPAPPPAPGPAPGGVPPSPLWVPRLVLRFSKQWPPH